MSLNYMPYTLIFGVIIVSIGAAALVGFGDAWFVPLIVLAFALPYLIYDHRSRNRGSQAP
jgi:predicted membrane protein